MSLRSALVRAAAVSAYHAGALPALNAVAGCVTLGRRGRALRKPSAQILTYHRVNDDHDPFFPSTPTETFQQQMEYISRSFRVMTVEDIVDRMDAGTLPRNALAITFDDGYRDTLTHAAPILARYGLPATVFLATGFVGAGEFPWFDQLALALKLTRVSAVMLPDGKPMPLGSLSERLLALDQALSHLKRTPDCQRREEMTSLLSHLGVKVVRYLKDLMLSWDDVHALTGLGFSIGAHTVNHPILSRVTLAQAEREIMGSKVMIETALGRPVKAFAYPNGRPEDYTQDIKQLVQQIGFTCAVTTRHGVNSMDDDRYELKRGAPWDPHLPSFALKLVWYRLTQS